MRNVLHSLVPLSLFLSLPLLAQENTVGLIHRQEGCSAGYTLFEPLNYNDAYLIDNNGELVHRWEGDRFPQAAIYLLENGDLLKTANPDMMQLYNWEGELLWQWETGVQSHHDVAPLPNGNLVVLAYEEFTVEEAVQMGRNPQLLADDNLQVDFLFEVRPILPDSAEIVWEWHLVDHLIQDFDSTKDNFGVVENHPELLNVNYSGILPPGEYGDEDWLHTNAVDYRADLDQLLFNPRNLGELFIIDHSTTSEEAAGHTGGNSGRGGDILYRWGNPEVYRAGDFTDRQLWGHHDTEWIPAGYPGAGNITVFNNGAGRPGDVRYSSVEEIVPPLLPNGLYELAPGGAYGPAAPVWSWSADPPASIYSGFISGAHRLPNGNTLICSGGQGIFIEVTSDMQEVWRYVNPVTPDGPVHQGEEATLNRAFRCTRYPLDYPAFEGRDLTPQGPIELPPLDAPDSEFIPHPSSFTLSAYPNPFNPSTTISFSLLHSQHATLTVYDLTGRLTTTLADERMSAGEHTLVFDASGLASGIYFARLAAGNRIMTRKMILIR